MYTMNMQSKYINLLCQAAAYFFTRIYIGTYLYIWLFHIVMQNSIQYAQERRVDLLMQ